MSTRTPTRPERRSRSRRAPQPPPRRLPLLPLALGAVVLVGIVAIAVSRGGDRGPAETAPVSIEGEALPELAGGADTAAGRPAPVVTGTTLDGQSLTVGGSGPTLVMFVAHWCHVCQAEVPVVQAWVDGGGLPAGVELVSVASATRAGTANYPPSAWLQAEGWTTPVLLDDTDSSAAAAYGLSGFPFFVVLDADGEVIARRSGQLPPAELDALVELVSPRQ